MNDHYIHRQWNTAFNQPQVQLEQEYDYQQLQSNDSQYRQYPNFSQSIPNDYPFNPSIQSSTSPYTLNQGYEFNSTRSQNASVSNNFLPGSSAIQQQQHFKGVSTPYDTSFANTVDSMRTQRPALSLSPPPIIGPTSLSLQTNVISDRERASSSVRGPKGKRPRMNDHNYEGGDDEDIDAVESKEKATKPYVFYCTMFLIMLIDFQTQSGACQRCKTLKVGRAFPTCPFLC